MSSISKAVTNVLKRGGFAFLYYPASMLFAICLAFLSIWMIYDNPANNLKLFNTLQLSFAFGAFLNMALCVIAKKTDDRQFLFILANVASLVVTAGVFCAVFFTAGTKISSNSLMRVLAGMAISFIVFVFVPTFRSKRIHYNQMVFMNLRAFFVAVVYSLFLMLGFFFVAFAVKSLLYEAMSEKIYSYIAILSGLFAYAFFLGYFPDFKKEEDETDARIDKAIKQPRFAEILFQNIMIPIIAAMTIVLLIWSIRILITREWPVYSQTISIFTTYALVGIFIYFLVSSYDTLIVRLYKKIIPVATLIFLAFEAYPIINRIILYGVKPAEYAVVFLWLYAVMASILFLFIPVVKNRIPTYIAALLIAIIVLPVIGATDLSFTLQARRLESILTKNGMLKDGGIVAGNDIALKEKKDITDATEYLFNQENKTAPDWLLKSLPSLDKFRDVYGFERLYYSDSGKTPGPETIYTTLRAESAAIPLEDYQYYIANDLLYNNNVVPITTDNGNYRLEYTNETKDIKTNSTTPGIIVRRNGKEVLNGKLDNYLKQLEEKYLKKSAGPVNGDVVIPIKEMSCEITGENVRVKLVYQSITMTSDSTGVLYSSFIIQGIYFKELA